MRRRSARPFARADLGGVVTAGLRGRAVSQKATHLLDTELLGNTIHNASRHLSEVLQKCTQKACDTQLNGETQPAVIATPGLNQMAVAVIQVEVSIQLLL